jgi:hypothetical protein
MALRPPSLTVVLAGNQCVVSWPASAQGFVLEISSDLSQASNWLVVTNVPLVVDLQNFVTTEISDGARFYRLHRQ